MKVLIQFDVFSKLRTINSGKELPYVIESTFNLHQGIYFIKKFDKDFQEFVDVEDLGDICNMDKLKVCLIKEGCSFVGPNEIYQKPTSSSELVDSRTRTFENTSVQIDSATDLSDIKELVVHVLRTESNHPETNSPCLPSTSNQSIKSIALATSNTQSVQRGSSEDTAGVETAKVKIEPSSVDESFQEVICLEFPQDPLPVLPLRLNPWPKEHNLPYKDFSKKLLDCLANERILNYDLRRELVMQLAEYAYSFKRYPSRVELQEICQTLATKYPHIQKRLGLQDLELKVNYKLKRMRSMDSAVEVQLKKRYYNAADKSRGFIGVSLRRGELNWDPSHITGETAGSQEVHKNLMAKECLEKSPDEGKLTRLMGLTYSYRREQINAKVPIQKLKKAYPALFLYDQQLLEFERLTAVNIRHVFFESVKVVGPILCKLFMMKVKKNDGDKALLKTFEKICVGLDSDTLLAKQADFGIVTLPQFLREGADLFISLVAKRNSPQVVSPFPKILGIGTLLDANYVITYRGEELFRTGSVQKAVCLLISCYYTLSIPYPEAMANILKFIQNVLLKLRGGAIPKKVITLINRVEAFC